MKSLNFISVQFCFYQYLILYRENIIILPIFVSVSCCLPPYVHPKLPKKSWKIITYHILLPGLWRIRNHSCAQKEPAPALSGPAPHVTFPDIQIRATLCFTHDHPRPTSHANNKIQRILVSSYSTPVVRVRSRWQRHVPVWWCRRDSVYRTCGSCTCVSPSPPPQDRCVLLLLMMMILVTSMDLSINMPGLRHP